MNGYGSTNNDSRNDVDCVFGDNGVDHDDNGGVSSTTHRDYRERMPFIRENGIGSTRLNGDDVSNNTGGPQNPLPSYSSPSGDSNIDSSVFNPNSFTYIDTESDVWNAHVAAKHLNNRGGSCCNVGKRDAVVRYASIALIGIIQACVAFFANWVSRSITRRKFMDVGDLMNESNNDSNSNSSSNSTTSFFPAFLLFYSYQTILAALSTAFVYIAPNSAGSGIPEIKCILNGVDLPEVTSLKTGICKVLGVICSVSAGLPVGKEGPMVHSGTVIASTISRRTINNNLKIERDLMACGAATGVCTAFGAPIGGMLFALEEGASHWSPSLTWHTFFGCMISFACLLILDTVGTSYGKVGLGELFSFGRFDDSGSSDGSNGDDMISFAIIELPIFAILGAIGGLVGACFNAMNAKITRWRIKRVHHSKMLRAVEVLILSSLVTTVSFLLPLLFGECRTLPSTDDLPVNHKSILNEFVSFNCKKGVEYNEMASLIFTDAGSAVHLLFHAGVDAFSPSSLIVFAVLYLSLASLVYGIAVPSGLFVPSLLGGAALGRLFGMTLRSSTLLHDVIVGSSGGGTRFLALPNAYALIGAASVLGGMARMTVSLTVILLECTGNQQFVLPLMISLMMARLTGGLFNEDLYHIHIDFKKGVNFLENELRSITRHHYLMSGHIMGEKLIFLRPIEEVGVVYEILKTYSHSTFPIVDDTNGNVLYGTISRRILCTLLNRRAFDKKSLHEPIQGRDGARSKSIQFDPHNRKFIPLVQWSDIHRTYPKYPVIQDVLLSDKDRKCMIDLRPYTNTTPYTVQETASVNRAYNLFRLLGLRILMVVNTRNQCVGTITRDDLACQNLAQHILKKGKNT